MRVARLPLPPPLLLLRRVAPPLCLRARPSRAPLGTLGATMKVYTRTGDAGTTGLFSGERRFKDDAVFEALGAVDELNAGVGLAREWVVRAIPDSASTTTTTTTTTTTATPTANRPDLSTLATQLEEIMSRLFDVGAAVATPRDSEASSESRLRRTKFDEANIDKLEKWIDAMDEELEPLKQFILPSGGVAAAQLHVARTLARTAERRVWTLIRAGAADEVVGKFLNRLSDYLFVAARFAAKRSGGTEKFWAQQPKMKSSE